MQTYIYICRKSRVKVSQRTDGSIIHRPNGCGCLKMFDHKADSWNTKFGETTNCGPKVVPLHSLKLTVRAWKWMVGRGFFPFGTLNGPFSGAKKAVSIRECFRHGLSMCPQISSKTIEIWRPWYKIVWILSRRIWMKLMPRTGFCSWDVDLLVPTWRSQGFRKDEWKNPNITFQYWVIACYRIDYSL